MATTRQKTLEDRLQRYLDAEISILDGAQSYKIGSRELTRANLSHIKEMIDYLEKEINVEKSKELGKGRNKSFGVIPRDF